MTFRTLLQLDGRTATGVEVPAAVVDALGAGRRPPVRVTLAGHAYRSTVAVRGGVFKLPVSAEVRAAAGVAAGDVVDVTVELDTEPRTVAVPPQLAVWLARDPGAQQAFDRLSPSAQKRHVLPIEQARTPETRERRIATTLAALRA